MARLWAFTEEHIVAITKDNLENTYAINKIQIPQDLRQSVKGYETINKLKNDEYLLGTSNGYLLINPNVLGEEEYNVSINSILNAPIGGIGNAVALKKKGILKAGNNNIAFTFSMPEFDKYQIAEYQWRLIGLYDQWTDWEAVAQYEYNNLAAGDYTFEVRGRVGDTTSKKHGHLYFYHPKTLVSF